MCAGAVSLAGGVSVLEGNVFQSNTAEGFGGAVAFVDQCFSIADTSGICLTQTSS